MAANTKIIAISHQDLVLVVNSEKSPCGFTLPIIQNRTLATTSMPKISPVTRAISHFSMNKFIINHRFEPIHFLFELKSYCPCDINQADQPCGRKTVYFTVNSSFICIPIPMSPARREIQARSEWHRFVSCRRRHPNPRSTGVPGYTSIQGKCQLFEDRRLGGASKDSGQRRGIGGADISDRITARVYFQSASIVNSSGQVLSFWPF